MVSEVEDAGDICRDEGEGKLDAFSASVDGRGQEIHWWVNIFSGYVWDGQVDAE